MFDTSSDLPRKSSAIFGLSSEIFVNFPKLFENFRVHVALGQFVRNLRKSSENGWKCSENRQKRRYQYVYLINKTRHGCL